MGFNCSLSIFIIPLDLRMHHFTHSVVIILHALCYLDETLQLSFSILNPGL